MIDRGTAINRAASACAHLVEAREALAKIPVHRIVELERARVRLLQAEAELESAVGELAATGGPCGAACAGRCVSPQAMAAHLEQLRLHLQGWANQLAARFGAPVYLVGSSLTDPEARDVDVRVVLDDDSFQARYGILPQHVDRESWGGWSAGSRRWGADVAKISRQAAVALRLNVDFQIQAALLVQHHGLADRPRVRLDTLDLTELDVDQAPTWTEVLHAAVLRWADDVEYPLCLVNPLGCPFLAFPLGRAELPEQLDHDEAYARRWYETNMGAAFGRGATPEDALADLRARAAEVRGLDTSCG